jgi:hypothetical protein
MKNRKPGTSTTGSSVVAEPKGEERGQVLIVHYSLGDKQTRAAESDGVGQKSTVH